MGGKELGIYNGKKLCLSGKGVGGITLCLYIFRIEMIYPGGKGEANTSSGKVRF